MCATTRALPRGRSIAATRSWSSTTPPPTGRPSSCASASSVRLVELPENRGFGAANNVGMEVASGELFPAPQLGRLAGGGRNRASRDVRGGTPPCGVVGPRLLEPGRDVAAVGARPPTLWRLATEYLSLAASRLARALNAFYGAGFDHRSEREVEVLKGRSCSCGREAAEAVGLRSGVLHVRGGVDLCYPQAGWSVVSLPGRSSCTSAASRRKPAGAGGLAWPMRRDQLRGHLRFLADHESPARGEQARRLLVAAFRLRGPALPRRGVARREETADWLASASAGALIASRG